MIKIPLSLFHHLKIKHSHSVRHCLYQKSEIRPRPVPFQQNKLAILREDDNTKTIMSFSISELPFPIFPLTDILMRVVTCDMSSRACGLIYLIRLYTFKWLLIECKCPEISLPVKLSQGYSDGFRMIEEIRSFQNEDFGNMDTSFEAEKMFPLKYFYFFILFYFYFIYLFIYLLLFN